MNEWHDAPMLTSIDRRVDPDLGDTERVVTTVGRASAHGEGGPRQREEQEQRERAAPPTALPPAIVAGAASGGVDRRVAVMLMVAAHVVQGAEEAALVRVAVEDGVGILQMWLHTVTTCFRTNLYA